MTSTYHLPTYVGSGEWGWYVNGALVIDLAESPHSYRVKGLCRNCKWEGQIRILRGNLVTRLGKVDCPACGCGTVEGGSLIATDGPDNDSKTAYARALADDKKRTEYMLELREQERKGRRR